MREMLLLELNIYLSYN